MLETDHRQITVLFCDLSGSTELTESIDPETLRDIILAYRRVVRQAIISNGGTVAEYAGDDIVAYFGYPESTENDVETAIRTGLNIIDSVQELVIGERQLQSHIGIATGSVVVGDASATEESSSVLETPQPKFLAFGSPNNLAARLLSVANARCVVVSDLTHKLAGDVFEYEDMGTYELRGYSQPVQAWRVVRERVVSSRHQALRARAGIPFVGRTRYLEMVSSLWAEVQSSRCGRVLLIHGDGGIGKSCLVEQALQKIVSNQNFQVTLPCEPHLTQSAYSPIVNQICRAALIQHSDTSEIKRRKIKRSFSSPLQNSNAILEVISFLVTGDSDTIKKTTQMSGDRLLSYIFEHLYTYLTHVCQKQPMVIVVEDMHWIDPSTARMFKHLLARLNELPILVLSTSRTLLNDLDANNSITEVALKPLSSAESAELVSNIAMQSGESISQEITNAICKRSDGIPLFLEDITLDYFERRTADSNVQNELKAIPQTLQDSLEARLGRLSQGRRIAQVAAVFGREFDLTIVKDVVETSAEQFDSGVNELIDAGLIVGLHETGLLDDTKLKFKHILIRDAAYNSLTKADKKSLHQQFAELLANKLESGNCRPEDVAKHHEAAHLWPQACKYWIESGRLCLKQTAFAEAESHFSRARTAVQNLPDNFATKKTNLVILGLLATAIAGKDGYAANRCEAILNEAMDIVDDIEFCPEIFLPTTAAASYFIMRGDFAKTEILANTCLSHASNDAVTLPQISAYRILGSVHFLTARFETAKSHLTHAIQLCDDSPTPLATNEFVYTIDQKTTALCYLALSQTATGELDEGLRSMEAGLEHAEKTSNQHTLNFATCFLAAIHLIQGNTIPTEEIATRSLAIANEYGFGNWGSVSLIMRGHNRVRSGRIQEGFKDIETGSAMMQQDGQNANTYVPFMMSLVSKSYFAVGKPQEALGVLQKAIDLTHHTNEIWYLAELLRLQGIYLSTLDQATQAVQLIQKAAKVAQEQGAMLWQRRATESLARVEQKGDVKAEFFCQPSSITADSEQQQATRVTHDAATGSPTD